MEQKLSDNDTIASKVSEIELTATPKFVTSPQSIIVNEGDTVRLPCMVERLEGFVLLWKRNVDMSPLSHIITVASQIIDKAGYSIKEHSLHYLYLESATRRGREWEPPDP